MRNRLDRRDAADVGRGLGSPDKRRTYALTEFSR